MTDHVRAITNIVGRIMLATIFLMSAVGNKIPDFGKVSEYMTSEGILESTTQQTLQGTRRWTMLVNDPK